MLAMAVAPSSITSSIITMPVTAPQLARTFRCVSDMLLFRRCADCVLDLDAGAGRKRGLRPAAAADVYGHLFEARSAVTVRVHHKLLLKHVTESLQEDVPAEVGNHAA